MRHRVAERGVVLAGSLIGTDARGNRVVTLPGMYWYMPAGTVHGGLRCGPKEACLIYESYDDAIDVEIVPPVE